jgi:hypothetical protein
MNSNALETMIVPVVRGIFLVLMLGAAARGLVRMVAIIAASARHPGGSVADLAPAALAARAEADRLLHEETLSAGLA